jgi:hypothetical protein
MSCDRWAGTNQLESGVAYLVLMDSMDAMDTTQSPLNRLVSNSGCCQMWGVEAILGIWTRKWLNDCTLGAEGPPEDCTAMMLLCFLLHLIILLGSMLSVLFFSRINPLDPWSFIFEAIQNSGIEQLCRGSESVASSMWNIVSIWCSTNWMVANSG